MITQEIVNIMALIIFIGLAFTQTKRFFSKMINAKIAQIYKDIDESIKIRQEAEISLAQTVKENELIDKKCKEIMILTNNHIKSLRAGAEKKLIELEKKQKELIKQAILHQNQLKTSRLRNYLLQHVFSEIEKELQSNDCRHFMKNDKLDLHKLVNNSVH